MEGELSETSESDPSVYTSSEDEVVSDEKVNNTVQNPPDRMAGDFYINNKSLVIHPVLQVARPGYFKCGRQLGWPYTYQTV